MFKILVYLTAEGIMRIELSIYANKKQRERMKRVAEQFILICFTPLQKVLPVIEVITGGAMLLLLCCMDSENLQVVLHWALNAGLIFCFSLMVHCYIRDTLRRVRTERLKRRVRHAQMPCYLVQGRIS